MNTPWDTDQVSVIMPSQGRNSARYRLIEEECKNIGLTARHIRDIFGGDRIFDEIRRRILRAEFIIFDFTSETSELYYELGYAEGVGNAAMDMFLIAESGTTHISNFLNINVEYFDSDDTLRAILRTKFHGNGQIATLTGGS